MPSPHRPSVAVRRMLRKFGQDIKDARRRRHLTMEIVADRAFTTRQTLQKVEAGNGMVSIGIYAAALQALGLLDRLGELAAPSQDEVGLSLSAGALPRRVRLRMARPNA